jgi:hypothetical protein
MAELEMWQIRKACWKKDFYVIIKPQSRGKLADCKLLMSAQGSNKLGDIIWKQDKEMYKKIDEMYLYMYKNFIT